MIVMRAAVALWIATGLCLPAAAASAGVQDPLDIEIPEVTRRWWAVGGHLEARPVFLDLDQQSAAYRLRYFSNPDDLAVQTNLQLLVDGSAAKGPLELRARAVGDLNRSQGLWLDSVTAYEAYVSYRPSTRLSLAAGKRTLKWGKGYAWNPVAFLDRPKNPDDPALAQEGFWTVSADLIRSGRGALQTVSFTPVLVPVTRHMNQDLGRPEGLHAAGRLYLLWLDTDIDVIALAGSAAAPRFGVDLSRNLTPAIEVHAEVAQVGDAIDRTLGTDGRPANRPAPATNLLAGVRFVLPTNTTFIVEHHHSEAGVPPDAFERFIDGVADAWTQWTATGDARGLTALSAVSQPYLRPTGMRDYLFVRASQPELFGNVYLSAALTAIVNERDGSFSLTQESLYKATTDLELRSQLGWIAGRRGTDFGERQADLRWEIRARYYF